MLAAHYHSGGGGAMMTEFFPLHFHNRPISLFDWFFWFYRPFHLFPICIQCEFSHRRRKKFWSFLLHRPRFFDQRIQLNRYVKANWSFYEDSNRLSELFVSVAVCYLAKWTLSFLCMMFRVNRWFHLAETGCGEVQCANSICHQLNMFVASKWETLCRSVDVLTNSTKRDKQKIRKVLHLKSILFWWARLCNSLADLDFKSKIRSLWQCDTQWWWCIQCEWHCLNWNSTVYVGSSKLKAKWNENVAKPWFYLSHTAATATATKYCQLNPQFGCDRYLRDAIERADLYSDSYA